ncbi:hypothetical protein LCGC14_0960210 [marine sediment metagenome]|uniref:Uncharacterized protein n=1 Tax=marine sediment metagenome TaxID=412755 RepID=A0A0F9NEP4_9ZZZZ
MEVPAPIQGILKGLPSNEVMKNYSEYMNNCRPQDVLEKRIRMGQRPGLEKWGAGTQIGGSEQPIVALITVSSVV